ncbi:unnamed protein product, partial [Didymodactylos carnosus]
MGHPSQAFLERNPMFGYNPINAFDFILVRSEEKIVWAGDTTNTSNITSINVTTSDQINDETKDISVE